MIWLAILLYILMIIALALTLWAGVWAIVARSPRPGRSKPMPDGGR